MIKRIAGLTMLFVLISASAVFASGGGGGEETKELGNSIWVHLFLILPTLGFIIAFLREMIATRN